MFAIAWKDIRERWWVGALITLIALAGFAVLSGIELLRPLALVELLIFLASAVTLTGVLAFAEERANRTHVFLANLPESSLRIWLSKAAASFVIMALVTVVGLYAAGVITRLMGVTHWLADISNMPVSFPFHVVPAVSFFWAMGLLFSLVFDSTALGVVVGTFVSVGLLFVFAPVGIFMVAVTEGLSAPSHFPPFTRLDQALIAGLIIVVPLVGSLLGYVWSRHRRLSVWQRAAFPAALLAIWVLGTGAVTARAVVRGLTSSACADWVVSDGSGGFIIASEGAQRSWPRTVLHEKADGSVRAWRQALNKPVFLSQATSGEQAVFAFRDESASPASYVLGDE